ncbi:MAG: hypothetical protein LH470_02830 [Lysobacter sp.]|nr:hypothetical protein [Lysobacter sp.]
MLLREAGQVLVQGVPYGMDLHRWLSTFSPGVIGRPADQLVVVVPEFQIRSCATTRVRQWSAEGPPR